MHYGKVCRIMLGLFLSKILYLKHRAYRWYNAAENCEKSMQILPATPARMYKVYKSGNILGILYLSLVSSAPWYNRRPGYLFMPGF